MHTISVLQNTDWEYLGFVEDHFEGRNIRFRYIRPAHQVTWQKTIRDLTDGLVILGAAPYGTVSDPVIAGLQAKIDAIGTYLDSNLPVVGFGSGAQMLALACGYSVEPRPMTVSVETAYKTNDDALNGFLPERYPVITFMQDVFEIPDEVKVLSRTQSGQTALFQLNGNCFGFLGHPGMKSAMIEDALVQCPEHSDYDIEQLQSVRNHQDDIASSLVSIMTGLIQVTGWMRT